MNGWEYIVIMFEVLILCMISLGIGIKYGRENPKKKRKAKDKSPETLSPYDFLPMTACDAHDLVEANRKEKNQELDEYKEKILNHIINASTKNISKACENMTFITTVGLYKDVDVEECEQLKIDKSKEEPYLNIFDTTYIWENAKSILEELGYKVDLDFITRGESKYNYLKISW